VSFFILIFKKNLIMTFKWFLKFYFSLLFSLFCTYIYFAINQKNIYMNREFPMWQYVKAVMKGDSSDYNLIILGDSRSKAGLKPDHIDDEFFKSVNLSVGGGTPIEGFYILKNYISKNIIPKYLVISFSPNHLSHIDSFWDRTVKFNFLSYKNLNEVVDFSRKNEGCDGLIGCEKKIYKYFLYPQKYFKEVYFGLSKRNWLINQETFDYAVSTRGHAIFGTSKFSDGKNVESNINYKFEPTFTINHYFIETIKLAKENNMQIFYYTMPFNKSSFQKTSNLNKLLYDNYLSSICLKYQIKCLNKLYFLPNTAFGDPHHLYNGTKQVSFDLRNRLLSNVEKDF